MRSLRARLVAVTAVVAVVAVGVNALVSRQVVTTEFRRLEHLAGPVPLEPAIRALAALREAGGGWRSADSLLVLHGRRLGRALVVTGRDGAALAASHAPMRRARITAGPGGAFRVVVGATGGPARSTMVLDLRSPPRAALAGADSGSTLFALPPPDDAAAGAAPSLRVVERGLLAGVAAAIALGALLVWVLSARVLGPVEALTAAARRMAAGDLTPRVTPRGRDEVAGLAASFNAMADALAAAQASRRRLTRDVAHELRTPLTALRGQIEALEDGLLRPEPATLRSLRAEVVRLARLIEDLDHVAAAEDGSLRLDPDDVPAREALESAAASFSAAAAAAGVTLEVRAADGALVRADPLRLGQILRNLVANALAHTPAGGRVVLSARASAGGVALEVADSGAGIAPEHLPHVFERFYRTDPSRARAGEAGAGDGTGLGLAIVKHLAEAQGGAVRVASAPGRGATFVVELPAAAGSRD